MIRVLMLDLGDTLVHGFPPVRFPNVKEVLTEIAQLQTVDGDSLAICLVSDFTMPQPPILLEQLDAIFAEYVGILADAGLKEHFEPVDQRVTLSTHCGVSKPDGRVFLIALLRLRMAEVKLDECLFITENGNHIDRAKQLGMTTLRFRSTPGNGVDFHDWAVAPELVSEIINSP